MYLPVEQLHSRAESHFAKFEQGGGTSSIDEAIDLDRKAQELRLPGHPMRPVSLTCLEVHLSDCYDQLGATRGLEEAIVLDRSPRPSPARTP